MLSSTKNSWEEKFLLAVPLSLVGGSIAALLVRTHLHFHTARTAYGMWHLPEALLLAALFAAIASVSYKALCKSSSASAKPTSYYLTALLVAFCLCWLPVLLSGQFFQDDWMLLAGASIRKIIYIHPSYAWFSLDTVDGNFRPLPTTIYFAYMLKLFGLHAFPFLCGNFITNLFGSIVSFFIVRELGHSKMAAAAAAVLYMTRGLNYTEIAWACALGDGFVILLGGLVVIGILRANKRQGLSAFAYQALAWAFYCIALFAKQSSFSIPLIVVLLFLLRPGDSTLVPLRRRIGNALLALVAYSVPAAVVFFHGKSLLQYRTPYPISLTLSGVFQLLSYIPWYFVGVDFPYKSLNIITECVGAAILVGVVILVARVPQVLGKRQSDIIFLLLAAISAIAPFILLPTRTAPYYGSMFAFWISIALGIVLTRFGIPSRKNPAARNAYFALYLIVIIGVLDIRLKETGLIPSGGYIRGSFGMAKQKAEYDQMATILARHPLADTLVMVNFPIPAPDYTSMALLADPGLRRIMVYDTKTKTFLTNDLAGLRPKNELDALTDVGAYYWSRPIPSLEAVKVVDEQRALWIESDSGKIDLIAPLVRKSN